jgi:hypothetical protein
MFAQAMAFYFSKILYLMFEDLVPHYKWHMHMCKCGVTTHCVDNQISGPSTLSCHDAPESLELPHDVPAGPNTYSIYVHLLSIVLFPLLIIGWDHNRNAHQMSIKIYI